MARSKGMTEIRKGQAPATLSRDEFGRRYRASFFDLAFASEQAAISRLEKIAWAAYSDGGKAPLTRLAGWCAARRATTALAPQKCQSRFACANGCGRLSTTPACRPTCWT